MQTTLLGLARTASTLLSGHAARGGLIALMLGACVFKGAHERVQVQLDATQMAMSARAEQCQSDIQSLEQRLEELQQEIQLRQVQLDELDVRTGLRDDELAKLQEERVALAVLLERTLEENRALKKRIERLERRRRKPIEGPEDGEAESPGRRALADIQAKLEEDFQDSMAEQFVDRSHEEALAAFQPLTEAGYAEVLRIDDATVVRIPTAKLFQEGQSVLSPRGQKIVADLSAGLATIPGRAVSIEAHTDSAPVHSAQFPSNWEKGFGRAVVVLHGLEGEGAYARLSARSFAGTRPLVEGEPEQNRRVELVITMDPGITAQFEPTPQPEEQADAQGSDGPAEEPAPEAPE